MAQNETGSSYSLEDGFVLSEGTNTNKDTMIPLFNSLFKEKTDVSKSTLNDLIEMGVITEEEALEFIKLNPFAKGTDSTPDGPILVGEEAPELAIFPNGDQHILGQNGPEMVDIPEGSKIYNATDTKTILSHTGKTIDNKPLSQYYMGTNNNE